jgi:pullulanase
VPVIDAVSQALTLHYRRHRDDYAHWCLWLWPLDTSDPTPPIVVRPLPSPAPQTSWGAVFRVPLSAMPPGGAGLLPFTPGWAAKDEPERALLPVAARAGVQLFLLEGDAGVLRSPLEFCVQAPVSRPRFLAVRVERAEEAVAPWLRAFDSGEGCVVRRDVYPGVGGVCFVDLLGAEGRPLGLEAVAEAEGVSAGGAVFWDPCRDDHVVALGASGLSKCADEVVAIVASEVVDVDGLCLIHPGATAASPVEAPVGPARILLVHYLSSTKDEAVALRALGRGIMRTTDLPVVLLPEARDAADVAVFGVDLAHCPEAEIARGLSLALTVTQPAAGNDVSSESDACPPAANVVTRTAVWSPLRDGMSVCLFQGGSALLSLEKATCQLLYYRYDGGGTCDEWELRVCRGNSAATELPFSISPGTSEYILKPTLLDSSTDCSAMVFSLSMALCSPKSSTFFVQPVRMETVPGDWVDCQDGYQERYQLPPRREVVSQDLVRRLDFAELIKDEAAPGIHRQRVHLVQGQMKFTDVEPTATSLAAHRFLVVDYRRHAENDHSGWDLWCYEDSDVPRTSHAVAPTKVGGMPGLRFLVDRAAFGAGVAIRVLPRRGGDSWSEKDEPSRLVPCHNVASEDRQALLVAQGTHHVLVSLEDARRLLRAYVESQKSLVVESPVPFEWLAEEAEVEVDLEPVVTLVGVSRPRDQEFSVAQNWRSLPGRQIRAHSVQRACPVSLRFSTDPELVDDVFDEDFLVERTVVTLPGFNACVLQWREYADLDKYLYRGALGWQYTPEECIFRCFAPSATSVFVVLYKSPRGGKGKQIPMRRIPEGCWKAMVNRDLKGMYYKLLANSDDKRLFPGVEVIDPYSRCNTGHKGRGLIFGSESTVIAPRPDIRPEHSILYELHLRDATIDLASGVQRRGKYLGMTELGTFLKPHEGDEEAQLDLSTCLSHIVSMGVTAVQILPIQDFDNDEEDDSVYNWGYMPVHFNSPDGWYASDTTSVARVREFKQLVDAFHRANLKVIMDVVYNHTAEDGNELNLDARFSFNGLAPRYYYRNCWNTPVAYNGDSTCAKPLPGGRHCGTCASNGSGCGNEFRSESPMGRKFLLDSLKYWVNEYQVDGFRFDLLGLIDVETLTLAAAELHAIDPNIVLYGEPWCGGLTPIRTTEKGMQRSRGFGVFNDTFRNALRGSTFNIGEETFVMDGCRLDEVKRGIIGSIDDFADGPLETINYVECHDNYTLEDHFRLYVSRRTDDIVFSDSDFERMHKLAAAIIFTSQGIPMMQIGQEMCRTKFGVENSYNAPDKINAVRWETKRERSNVVSYFKGLIELRRKHPELFCITDAAVIRSRVTFFEDLDFLVPPQCIAYRILSTLDGSQSNSISAENEVSLEGDENDYSKWEQVVVLFNAAPADAVFPLPEADVFQHWLQVVDPQAAGCVALGRAVCGEVAVPGRSAAVFRRASKEENHLQLVDIRLQHVSDAGLLGTVVTPYCVGLTRERSVSEQGIASASMNGRSATRCLSTHNL